MGRFNCLLQVIMFFVLYIQGNAKAREVSPLLDQVRAAHKSALQAIRTMSATFRVEVASPKHKELIEGKYWRDGNTVRVHYNGVRGGRIDYRVSAGEVRQVITLSTDR